MKNVNRVLSFNYNTTESFEINKFISISNKKNTKGTTTKKYKCLKYLHLKYKMSYHY